MDLLKMVLAASNSGMLGQIAEQNNLSADKTSDVLSQLLPELTNHLQKNVQQDNGTESLLAALGKGNHQRYIDQPELLAGSSGQREGNKILGHLLGSKDASRQVAAKVGSSTGVSDSTIKKLLPMAATMLMGSMGKGAESSDLLGQLGATVLGGGKQNDLLGSLLGSLSQNNQGDSGQSGAGDVVSSLLKNFLK